MKQQKRVALVLSSGGARGLAHIAVIEELQKRGYEIGSVAGASMGALVGGMYAAGDLYKFKRWVTSLDMFDVFKLMDFSFSLTGFIRGDRVLNEIKKMIPDRNIETLGTPFTALAVDLKNKKEVVFDKGSLYKAIRASISIPMVFSPVITEESILVDGGLMNPIPVDYVAKQEGDLLVVVNVNAATEYDSDNVIRQKREEESNRFIALYREKIDKLKQSFTEKFIHDDDEWGAADFFNQTIGTMLTRISSLLIEKSPPDILIEISRKAGDTFDFYRAKEIIAEGKKQAARVLDGFESKQLLG